VTRAEFSVAEVGIAGVYPFSFLRARTIKRVIARSETTKQSPFVKRRRLLRYARNDKFDRDFHPAKLNDYAGVAKAVHFL